MVEESHRCSGCGTFDWQWDEDWDFAEPESYVCRGCARLANERKNHEKNPIPGLHFRLIPKEVARAQQPPGNDRR